MLNNLTASISEPISNYFISDSNLPFTDYIARNRHLIQERRPDLQETGTQAKLILDVNSPFECYPANPITSGKKLKYGVLLLHGLLDCPFSLKDLGQHLQGNGILSRSILLPGHGTLPEDLLSVSYHHWIQAVRYGVESLRKEVDQVYLAGYSTGAALSVYQALQDAQISGIILLAPAIRIKVPMNIVVAFEYLKKWLRVTHNQWIYKSDEVDYAKYSSITFNAVNQVSMLTDALRDLRKHHSLTCPIFMAVSREDETISSDRAIDFFSHFHNQESKLLLYTSMDHIYPDTRIVTRLTQYPDLHIHHFSHISIPFSPNNIYYGQKGNYPYASHIGNGYNYGAYSNVETDICEQLHKLKLIKNPRRKLTYNPDFNYMAEQITQFIKG